MPEQFVVPQFLDVESKIIGPITARQFIILLATMMLDFLVYRIFLSVIAVLGLGIPILGIGLIFAFAKVNGQPFHYIILNMIQTFRKPFIRVWDKTVDDTQLRANLKKDDQPVAVSTTKKRPIERSRLSDISLIVNTGGAYNPDDEEYGG